MATNKTRPSRAPVAKAMTRIIVYYAVLFTAGMLLWQYLPHADTLVRESFDLLSGAGTPVALSPGTSTAHGEGNLALTVALAMIAAILLSVPVAWVYVLTRAKRGYQQSVVHLLIVLPLVVSGIVVLVQYSLALAFSLAGIVAAVRFRNTLDDSKDAVYVFLATAIGLSAAVNVPVAAVISVLFNLTVLTLWYLDFAHAPIELDGALAEKRLKRARQLARTGTFVARIDDEVFRNMTRDQLEGVAERAWKRAHETPGTAPEEPEETRVRIQTTNLESMRRALEPRLENQVKSWRYKGAVPGSNGWQVAEYAVHIKKKSSPEELLALVRAAGAPHITDAELVK